MSDTRLKNGIHIFDYLLNNTDKLFEIKRLIEEKDALHFGNIDLVYV